MDVVLFSITLLCAGGTVV